MKIVRAVTTDEALRQAAAALTTLLEPRVPILLLLSGGSAFRILDYVNAADFDQRITVGVLDERYSEDSQVNNFLQLQSSAFGAVARQRTVKFIDTSVRAGESLDDLAQRFERELMIWTKGHPEGRIVATMGMGSDGHTAGIMPYPENKILFKRLFDDVKHWVVGYSAEGKNEHRYRVTVTLPFLGTEVDYAVVFIAGESKGEVFKRIQEEAGLIEETPARIYRDMRNVTIFTDLKLS